MHTRRVRVKLPYSRRRETGLLRIYNTLTKSTEQVQPIEPGLVRMYTCGPTVYRDAHLRQPPHLPPRRLDSPRPPGRRPRCPPRQEHHRRRPHAPGPRRGRRRQGDSRCPGRGPLRIRTHPLLRRPLPSRRGPPQHFARPRIPLGHPARAGDALHCLQVARRRPRLPGRRQRLLRRKLPSRTTASSPGIPAPTFSRESAPRPTPSSATLATSPSGRPPSPAAT